MKTELVDLFRRELKDALRPYRAGKKAVAELRESEYLKGDEVIRAVQRELNKLRSKKTRALFSEITNAVALQFGFEWERYWPYHLALISRKLSKSKVRT